jgi:hypothetical protein
VAGKVNDRRLGVEYCLSQIAWAQRSSMVQIEVLTCVREPEAHLDVSQLLAKA